MRISIHVGITLRVYAEPNWPYWVEEIKGNVVGHRLMNNEVILRKARRKRYERRIENKSIRRQEVEL